MLLLLTSFVWGTAFVAQRKGMDFIGPMTYNAWRFGIGAAVLLPILWYGRQKQTMPNLACKQQKNWILWSIAAGALLFGGASLQQIGLVYTTAGKAGFITGLYVILVPMGGLLLGHRAGPSLWVGAALSIAGLYLLSEIGSAKMVRGDFFVLAGAFFWAGHVLLIGHLAGRANPFRVAAVQFTSCALFSLLAALIFETATWQAIKQAAIPIAYGGLLSVGLGFTLQVVSQRHCPPGHAAVIMSLETVFAAAAGWAVLGETLAAKGILGCCLILAGMLVVQIVPILKNRRKAVITCTLTESESEKTHAAR